MKYVLSVICILAIASACSSASYVPLSTGPNLRGHDLSAQAPIKHVVIIVQEGRTFENLFAGWPGADAPLEGSAQEQPVPVKLKPISYGQDRGMCELAGCLVLAYAGGWMNGFDSNAFSKLGSDKEKGKNVSLYPYAYLNHTDIAPYRALATQYVLADHMFVTTWGGDFTAHQDLIAGSTFVDEHHGIIDVPNARPWGCDAPASTKVPLGHFGGGSFPQGSMFPCVTQYPTMADLLDKAGLDWKYYVAPLKGSDASGQLWNAFDAIKRVRYGKDWSTHIISPPNQVLKDAANGSLPAVSWVIPKVAWSDHPSQTSDKGPSWVAAVVNAIGKGPDWNSTAIVIVWSEWGGWYDNASPTFLTPLKGSGVGLRVPCIIVSPFARKSYVSHSFYDYGSILRFVESQFGLGSLSSAGYGFVFADEGVNSIANSFNFNQSPRPFTPIAAKYPSSSFLK